VAAALLRLNGPQRPERITISGHGEPTLHPQFPDVVTAIRRVRDKFAPGVRLAILSNSSTAGNPHVRKALEQLDERYMKLDAGDDALVRRVNATTIGMDRILDGLRCVRDIVIQAMFVRDGQGRIDNSTDLPVAMWIAAVSELRPRAVHVYTLDRAPAWPYLQAVPAPRLQEIARRARAAGLSAEAFTAPGAAAANGRR
jgi:wyosine [tRNA(Phe)-imidazoG37] synthetase (radical SAM superfamily)